MCSKLEGEGRGWGTRVEDRERERRKDGVEGGMTQVSELSFDLLILDRHHFLTSMSVLSHQDY